MCAREKGRDGVDADIVLCRFGLRGAQEADDAVF
jgi:hypothetical protein